MADAFGSAAASIEMVDGLACGACGHPHPRAPIDFESPGDWCICCRRCSALFDEHLAESYPDIVGSSKSITEPMLGRMIVRAEERLAELEARRR
jgi:hypothetical protein